MDIYGEANLEVKRFLRLAVVEKSQVKHTELFSWSPFDNMSDVLLNQFLCLISN